MIIFNGTGGTAFTPTDEPSLDFWLKADSLALSDGDPVAVWEDQSLSGLDYGQSNATNKPTFKTAIVNGQPVVRFATNDRLVALTSALTWPTANTLIWVGTPSSTAAYLFSEVAFISGFGGKAFEYFWDASGVERRTFAVSASGFHILTLTRTNGTGNYVGYIDGAEQFSVAVTGPDWAFGLGLIGDRTGEFFNGDMAEMIHCSSILNSTALNNMHTYLGDKYGISITLI